MLSKSALPSLLSLLLLAFISGCTEDVNFTQFGQDLPDWQLTVYDSLVIPTPETTVYIMSEDTTLGFFLGLQPDWKTYSVIDEKGRELATNIVVGEAPRQVNVIAKIGLVANGSVFVVGNSKMILFSSTDTITHSFDTLNSLPFPYYHKLIALSDSTVIYSSANDQYDSLTPEYFAKSHTMSLVNVYTGEIHNFAPYHPDSEYRKRIIPNNLFPHFSSCGDSIYLLYPYDSQYLYLYDNHGKFARTISLSPSYFTPFEPPSGTEIADQSLFNQKNSSYSHASVNGDYLITQYTTPLPEELRTVNIAKINKLKDRRKNYIEIYDRLGKKLCKDVLLPKEVYKIWAAPSLDSILLLRHFDINENNVVLYKARLDEEL